MSSTTLAWLKKKMRDFGGPSLIYDRPLRGTLQFDGKVFDVDLCAEHADGVFILRRHRRRHRSETAKRS